MAVNQPIIGDDQADNSWKLEITNQANNEEARVNALASQLEAVSTRAITIPPPEIFEASFRSTDAVPDPAVPSQSVLTFRLGSGGAGIILIQEGVTSSERRSLFPTDRRFISTYINGLRIRFIQTRLSNPASAVMTVAVPEGLITQGGVVQVVIDERI